MKKVITATLLSCSLLFSINGTKSEASASSLSVADIASDYIGTPYAWGGTTPSGFDCSGFIRYTYDKVGVTLPRTAQEMYNQGASVSKTDLQEGDLVFFSTYKAGASHVGIYTGDNKFVHASSSGVREDSLSNTYWNNTYLGAKKVVDNSVSGWKKQNSIWSYYKSGSMVKGWLLDQMNWYYMDQNGSMKVGWVKDGGKWYYLAGSGIMKTGWLKDSGKWYFLNQAGDMKTGWALVNNEWYYMESGGSMRTGWLLSGGKWYYLQPSGAMAVNTTVGGYVIDANGVWVQ
ncbi:NlpC/P60 family protein [Cytobacillus gottheilii]|uniref:NlpC/P60 family protein n=1 Tax=Cytobacillus gottheilii TaxID=859144 RepID=UPI0009BAE618|nr:NlpC/P60 family protein [Cytobacillus gottheilii]